MKKRMCFFSFLILTLTVFAKAEIDPNTLPRVDWNFVSANFNAGPYAYTPFFVDDQNITMYSGGAGVNPNNGFLVLNTSLSNESVIEKVQISVGPDLKHYNYFRAPRVARSGSELWMLIEVSGCYSGCNSDLYPNRLAVYHSKNNGANWRFLDFVSVDGVPYVGKWFGHTGLIYNAKGSQTLDLKNLTQNRFITIGENRDIFVSADGINYKSISMNHPFPKDRLVFASMANTPFGFHLTTCANWSDKYYTTTVRHLFSKDLKNWYPIESNSYLKNPQFYKGIHLSYDEKSKKLWAISPCGSSDKCSFLAWLEPKDYLDPKQNSLATDYLPNGEFVHISGYTVMILNHQKKENTYTYQVRFADGTIDSGYTKEMFTLPLASYKRQGCESGDGGGVARLCVGDTVYVNGLAASLMGYNQVNSSATNYAIKYSHSGIVDTGYTREMISLP